MPAQCQVYTDWVGSIYPTQTSQLPSNITENSVSCSQQTFIVLYIILLICIMHGTLSRMNQTESLLLRHLQFRAVASKCGATPK